ncbi:MAG: NAD(P)H-dependent oxidoreductase subunit E [Chloroflexota bacterium]
MRDELTELDLSLLSPLQERYAGRGRDALLPMLFDCQSLYGWLPRQVQQAVSETLRVPLADIHGVIEFYTMLYNQPTAKKVVRICDDLACSLAGAEPVIEAIGRQLGLAPGETSADQSVTFELVPCLGMCDQAPCGLVGDRPGGHLVPEAVTDFLSGRHPEPQASASGELLVAASSVGGGQTPSLGDFLAGDGFEALKKAMAMGPEKYIDFIESCGILGRGGAMFPLGRKWRFTRAADGNTRFVVVNGDESEPGTFKDRCFMEEDPYAVLEGAMLAAYAVGAQKGWIFIRGEYPRAYRRLQKAVAEAREKGLLGSGILDSNFNFDVEIRRGAGAYVCGEETALFEAIEGRRGFPRIRPPFPTTHGLFGKPTAINNVETLVTARLATLIGREAWLAHGTKNSPGTKLFCLSGDVSRPGLYEAPFGVTVREMIERAGGVPDGREIRAILLGGAAGLFIDRSLLDMPLTYEDARANDVTLGSGVIMVFDDRADLRLALKQIGHFFAHESCGKCFPCQLGTQRQLEILEGDLIGPADKAALFDLGQAMTETSLCGLGQTASSAILSAIRLWPELSR